MGRPAKYTREQLQAAALRIVDRHGIGALSMRALAAALETGPMTLYNHVRDRQDLDVLVVDAVMMEARWSPPRRRGDWRAEVAAIATAGWRAARAHPHAIPLILTRRSRSAAVLDLAEALLAALARSGRSGRRLLVAFRTVQAFVTGFAQAELAGPLSVEAGERGEAVIRRVRALPKERFSRLIEIAGAASASDAEAEFRSGLALLLAGLEADRPPARGRSRPPGRL